MVEHAGLFFSDVGDSKSSRETLRSELARESGISHDINVDCTAAFAGKPAPTELALN